jgi:putative MATE family efflux protein
MEPIREKYDLTQGVIWKKLLAFFLPIAAGTLFQQLYNTVDAVVVGQFVGTEALAAVGGSTAQIIALFIGFFVALSGGAAVVIAQLFGARDAASVSRASHTAVALSLALGVVLTAAGVALTPWALRIMGTPADTLADSAAYLRIYFGGTVFVLLFNMGSSILRAVGDSRRPLYYLIACCLCNIVLDLAFVAGLGMGVAGAALATVLSQLLSTVLVLWQLCRTREVYRITPRCVRFHAGALRQMLRIGVPAGLQASMYNISNLIIQVAVNSLGTQVVAAWTMTGKIDGVYWALSGALGAAVMSFVGQNFGAGRTDRIKACLRVSMALFMAITGVLVAVLLAAARPGFRLFTSDQRVIAYAWEMVTYFVPYYFVWTFIEVISGVLRGVGDAVAPVVITGAGICALRLVWVATVFVRFHTVRGISLCYPVSWLVTAAALSVYYLRGHWLTRRPAAV